MKEVIVLLLAIIRVHTWNKGTVTIFGDVIKVKCNNTFDTFQILTNMSTSIVHVMNCPLPTVSYAVSLQKLVNVKIIKELWIVLTSTAEQLTDEHLIGIDLEYLGIECTQFFTSLRYVYDTKVTGNENITLSKPNRLDLNCFQDKSTVNAKLTTRTKGNSLAPIIRSVSVDRIQIFDCIFPADSFMKFLIALNINIEFGRIQYFVRKKILTLHSMLFANISMNALEILSHYKDAVSFDDDFFEHLPIEELFLRHVNKPPLPMSSRILDIALDDGASLGEWGGCGKLQRLKLRQWQMPNLTEGWLMHCQELRELILVQQSELTIQNALTGARSLVALTIQFCALSYLSEKLLADAVDLKNLTFSSMKLSDIHSRAFASQSRLRSLDLSGNGLNSLWNVNDMLKSLPELRNLSLGNNPDFDFCSRNLGQADGDPKPPPLLERISLRNTQLTELCFEEWGTLLYIDLSASNVTRLEFDKLPSPQRGPLEVDLRGNYITILPLSREDYTMMINKYNEQAGSLTIFVDLTLDCDCHHGWFARALRSLPRLHLKGAHCSNGQQLQDQPPEKLECDKFPCSECSCRHAWQDNVTEADCHGTGLRFTPNLTRLPNLRTLLVSNNHIDTLQEEDIGETLLVMDLRDNLISRINPEVLAKMFAVPERNVWLSHNPFVCDCDNVILIIMLQEHKTQVPDFDQITCISDGEKIFAVSEVNADTLCSAAHERSLLIISASGGSLIALIALATVFLYRYWSELKIFLYSRGWCLLCVTENEADADRQYDAFISFAHEDEQFVVEELLPWLEDYPDLKVCMHTRDWMPGEPILTQIISSVEQSRRTIVLLSRNFVRSVWGMLEFRTAHVSALREGRVRVIVIVLDDVIDDQSLDAELSRYLLTNTYLRWGSPRFWERLRFALPRCGLSPMSEVLEGRSRENSMQHVESSQDTLRDLYSQPDTEHSEESRSSAPCIRQPRDQRETSSSEQITLRTFSESNADG